jgi:hypothetical protein
MESFTDILFMIAIKRSVIVLLGVVLFAYCGNPIASRTGTLRIRITDQAFPYNLVRSVKLTASRLEVSRTINDSYTSIMSGPQTFDLITLQNGATENLALTSLPSSTYNRIRLTITQVAIELTDGRVMYPMEGDSSKIFEIPSPDGITIRNNQVTDLVIDFDLSRSFIAQGHTLAANGITGFSFNPTARIVDLATVGQIFGNVRHNNGTPSQLADDIALSGREIQIIRPDIGDTLSVVTNANGVYNAFFIPAGLYRIYSAATDSTASWSVDNIVVTTANATRQDILMAKQ